MSNIYIFFFFCFNYEDEVSKLKADATLVSPLTHLIEFVFEEVENIVGKEENAVYLYFLLF